MSDPATADVRNAVPSPRQTRTPGSAVVWEKQRGELLGRLRQREAILEAVCFAAEVFLSSASLDDGIQEVLSRLGRATQVSRVYVFRNRVGATGELVTDQIHEWVQPGVAPQIDNPALQDFHYMSWGFARWVEWMCRGEPIHGLVRELPPAEQAVLAGQEIVSIAVVPVITGEGWWGFIGFDDCQRERLWSPSELEALKTAANILGAAIERHRAGQKVKKAQELLECRVWERTRDLAQANAALNRQVREREQAEAALQEAARQLERKNAELARALAAANEAKEIRSRFLAGVSHEVRTPLHGITGMADLLRHSPLSGEQREWVEAIKDSAEFLREITDDILDLSKIEAGKMRLESICFDLASVVRAVIRLFAPQAQAKGLQLRGRLAREIAAQVEGDPKRLRQILTNLVGNALKFTERGEIAVSAECLRSTPEILEARFTVTDTGIGIAEDQLERIFDSFVQAASPTARRHSGVGLGLAISKQLVEMMGGTIGCSSRLGRGSTFWFTVSLHRSGATAAESAAAEQPMLPDRGESLAVRILVAEDNAVSRTVARRLLETLGYQVEGVSNGREAVEAMRRSAYDLVLMDVQMPEMDGLRAARLIRQTEGAGPLVPIIAITAGAMTEDRERCLEAGMDDYISKPVTIEQLRAVLSRWATERRPGRRDIL